jgi:hypothetical protein
MADTLLVLSSPMGVPLYSARGLKQTLAPIGADVPPRRTINGGLVDLSAPQFKKYASEIACEDQQAPALDGIWKGQQLTVDCVSELSYLTLGGTPQRTVVAGSSRTVGAFTFYRPQLAMRVMDFSTTTDEWGAQVGWKLSLEEE